MYLCISPHSSFARVGSGVGVLHDHLFSQQGLIGHVSYGEQGLQIGNAIIPRSMYSVCTITKSRLNMGFVPPSGSILVDLVFKNAALDSKESLVSGVLKIMSEKSPETSFRMLGVGLEDIYISLENPKVERSSFFSAKFSLRLNCRIANLYLAEALAKKGDNSLLLAYLDSYIDLLLFYSHNHVLHNKQPLVATTCNASTSHPTHLCWLLRVDQQCHGILDTIHNYCKDLSIVRKGFLHMLMEDLSEHPIAPSTTESEEYTAKFLGMLPKHNFPFDCDTQYTRALRRVEGYDHNRNIYCESNVYGYGNSIIAVVERSDPHSQVSSNSVTDVAYDGNNRFATNTAQENPSDVPPSTSISHVNTPQLAFRKGGGGRKNRGERCEEDPAVTQWLYSAFT